ncbi:hypothetical protein ACS3SW_17840 [Roseobacteraceae bacterium S113]
MPALRSTFEAAPLTMLGWIALACAVNLGLQIAAMALLKQRMPHGPAGATALVTGNRNLALFFAALPAAETHGLLPFLAAYQLPMYLTPLLLGWLYVSEGGGKR